MYDATFIVRYDLQILYHPFILMEMMKGKFTI